MSGIQTINLTLVMNAMMCNREIVYKFRVGFLSDNLKRGAFKKTSK